MSFLRLSLIFVFLMPNVSMALDIASSCKPDHKLCITIATKLSSILTNVIDLLFWVVLALLSIQFIYWIFDLIYKAFIFAGSEVSHLYQDYRSRSQMGEYIRLSDGSFVLAGSKQHQWLEYDGETVRFNNSEFDYSRREMFDDPAIDYLGKEQPEIIGYNDRYYDDVWSGGHSANAVDDGYDEEISIRFGWSRIIDRETGEDITDEPYDDWRD